MDSSQVTRPDNPWDCQVHMFKLLERSGSWTIRKFHDQISANLSLGRLSRLVQKLKEKKLSYVICQFIRVEL